MKKRKGIIYVLLPILITLSLYLVFYQRIECKPGNAGFWIIIALGMSIGVAITRVAQWSNTNRSDDR
jgi:hypothetical protein